MLSDFLLMVCAATAPRLARAVAQARPTMSCIHLVGLSSWFTVGGNSLFVPTDEVGDSWEDTGVDEEGSNCCGWQHCVHHSRIQSSCVGI